MMRYDKNFACFGEHSEWYSFMKGVGYVLNDNIQRK